MSAYKIVSPALSLPWIRKASVAVCINKAPGTVVRWAKKFGFRWKKVGKGPKAYVWYDWSQIKSVLIQNNITGATDPAGYAEYEAKLIRASQWLDATLQSNHSEETEATTPASSAPIPLVKSAGMSLMDLLFRELRDEMKGGPGEGPIDDGGIDG